MGRGPGRRRLLAGTITASAQDGTSGGSATSTAAEDLTVTGTETGGHGGGRHDHGDADG